MIENNCDYIIEQKIIMFIILEKHKEWIKIGTKL